MSAFPSSLALADRRQWLTVAQLAAATGEKRRTLQWACQHGDLAHCHRFKPNPNGGPDILEIDLLHSPEKYRLAYANQHATENGTALLKLTDKQRGKAAAMVTLLQSVDRYVAEQKALQPRATEKELIERHLNGLRVRFPGTPSLRTYYRARERWLAGGKSLVALADQRGLPGKGVKAEFDEPAFAFFSSIYLVQGEPKAKICYRMLTAKAHDEKWAVPSLPTVMRTLHERVPLAKQVELRQGKEARQNRCDAHIMRDWDVLAGNEYWVSDHCLLDVLGIDDLPNGDGKPIRMWLTTWMDERSRYIVGWRIHRGPNAREVMASFYYSVLSGGIPENIRIDNGKEYRCHRFAGGRQWREVVERVKVDETAVRPVLMELGVTPHFAAPYNARAKIVEPWHHHFVKEQYSRLLPGFCGGNTQEKPEQLAETIKAGGLLHWSLLVDAFRTAIEGYNLRSHESLGGKCPAFVRQEIPFIKKVADPRALAMLFQDCRTLMIGRMGLMIDGAAYGIGNPEIIQRQGERVHVRMDLSGQVGQVFVYEPNGRFICTAENAGRLAANATHEDVAQAIRTVKRANKMHDELATMMPTLTAVDPVEQIALLKRHGEIELERQGMGHLIATAGHVQADSIHPLIFDQKRLPPAPAASNGLRLVSESETEIPERTESLDSQATKGLLPDNILDVFSAG